MSETMKAETQKSVKPTLQLLKSKLAGKIVIEIVVKHSLACQELHAIICNLGYEPTVDITGRYSIFCKTSSEVDTARDPLVRFFNSDGTFSVSQYHLPSPRSDTQERTR